MKRDIDLVRAVLLAAEAHDSPLATRLTIPGYSQEQIDYHCSLLADAGLMHMADWKPSPGAMPSIMTGRSTIRLTWQGHEFLDASRENRVWQAAKARVEQAGGFTFEILKTVLVDLVKQQIGLP